jgi:transposase
VGTTDNLAAKLLQAERDIALRDAQIRHLEQLLLSLTRRLDLALPQTIALALDPAPKPQPAPLFDTPNEPSPAATPEPIKPPRRGHGPRRQPKLRVETHVGLLEDADRSCPACGHELQPIDGQVESSELIDARPREYVLVRVDRQKYRCTCGHIETALAPVDAPERAIEGGRYSLSVAAEVVVDKYVDHQPLARQTRTMARAGLDVKSQSLWDLVWAMAVLLEPVAQAIKQAVLARKAIGVDTTSWQNLTPKAATPFQLWCIRAEDAVFFDIRKDKSAASFKILLGEFAGWISVDMAATNLAGATVAQSSKLVGCWAHVLRKFRDAAKDHPAAASMCQLIGRLFELEAEDFESVEARARMRELQARPLLAHIKSVVEEHSGVGVTALDKAMQYLANHWVYLARYADSGDAWISNNPTERGIRGPVIGRRNHFGSKSDRGRKAAGTLYTLVETAKLLGIDPATYLVAAAKSARHGEVLTPADFLKLAAAR